MMFRAKRRSIFFASCMAAAGALLPTAVLAASCSASIDRTQSALDAVLVQRAATVRSAPESTAAKLGYQPTPASVAAAENEYGGWSNGSKAIAALRRARVAEAAGNKAACFKEVRAARRAVGLSGK